VLERCIVASPEQEMTTILQSLAPQTAGSHATAGRLKIATTGALEGDVRRAIFCRKRLNTLRDDHLLRRERDGENLQQFSRRLRMFDRIGSQRICRVDLRETAASSTGVRRSMRAEPAL